TRWSYMGSNFRGDSPINGSDHHRVVAVRDHYTGRTRLIWAYDQGIATGIDRGDGQYMRSLGDVPETTLRGGAYSFVPGTPNGNLQIAQLYAGAGQPNQLGADVARLRAMFYGVLQDNGQPQSDPNIIARGRTGYGNLNWTGPTGDGSDVAVSQASE